MDVLVHDYLFAGAMTPVAAPADGPWGKADTSVAGSPTLTAVAGYMVGTIANDTEVENLCLSFANVLAFDIDDLIRAEFWLKCSATYAATEQLAFGLCSARNDDIDTLTAHASFRLLGAAAALGAITCESDDGTQGNDKDDKDTGQTLAATLKRFVIDFASGLRAVSPPPSLGGKANVLFSMDDVRGNLMPVCRDTVFDMSNYTAGLQPYVQIQKTSAAGTPSFSLRRVRITEKLGA
jgi:hypothetical protein